MEVDWMKNIQLTMKSVTKSASATVTIAIKRSGFAALPLRPETGTSRAIY